jgi:hypothetical protein
MRRRTVHQSAIAIKDQPRESPLDQRDRHTFDFTDPRARKPLI